MRIRKHVENTEDKDIEEEWSKVSKAIEKVAEKIIGRLKSKKKKNGKKIFVRSQKKDFTKQYMKFLQIYQAI